MARPTKYNDQMLQKAREYGDHWRTLKDEIIPTVEGLAYYMGISRDTIYEWLSQEDKDEFSDIISKIKVEQGKILLNGSLKGDLHHVIAKLILSSKHDYKEESKTDITSKGEQLGVVVLPSKEASDAK